MFAFGSFPLETSTFGLLALQAFTFRLLALGPLAFRAFSFELLPRKPRLVISERLLCPARQLAGPGLIRSHGQQLRRAGEYLFGITRILQVIQNSDLRVALLLLAPALLGGID